MSYDSNHLILDLCNFSPRVQLNLQTMLCLLSDPPKVFILIIPLTFRPPKAMERPFPWKANLFQASKISLCTLFQSRPSSYQGNIIRLLGVELGQKTTSGELNNLPVLSYYLVNLTLMPRSDYYQFLLGLLFFSLIELLIVDHSPSLTEPKVYQVLFELNPLLQGCNVKAISLSASALVPCTMYNI